MQVYIGFIWRGCGLLLSSFTNRASTIQGQEQEEVQRDGAHGGM